VSQKETRQKKHGRGQGDMQDREKARTDPDEGINFYDKCDGNTSVDAPADERRKAGRSAISQRREISSR